MHFVGASEVLFAQLTVSPKSISLHLICLNSKCAAIILMDAKFWCLNWCDGRFLLFRSKWKTPLTFLIPTKLFSTETRGRSLSFCNFRYVWKNGKLKRKSCILVCKILPSWSWCESSLSATLSFHLQLSARRLRSLPAASKINILCLRLWCRMWNWCVICFWFKYPAGQWEKRGKCHLGSAGVVHILIFTWMQIRGKVLWQTIGSTQPAKPISEFKNI